MNKKNEVANPIDTNLQGLVEIVEKSVEHYRKQSPTAITLAETILEKLSSKDMIDVMDIDTQIKVFSMLQKSIINPIESLTRLIQSITALKERADIVDAKGELEELVDEVRKAKDNAKPRKNINTVEAEVVEQEE